MAALKMMMMKRRRRRRRKGIACVVQMDSI